MKFLKTILLFVLISYAFSARNLKAEEYSEVTTKTENKAASNINTQKSESNNNSKGKRRDDVDGGNSNNPGDKGTEAIAYNYTPNPGNAVKFDQNNNPIPEGFKKPTIVDNLPGPNDSHYYDNRKIEGTPDVQ